jgi:hypothetical protein
MNRMRSTFDGGGIERSPALESYADVERHIARAHRLRAEVIAQMLAAAFRSTAGALRTVALVRPSGSGSGGHTLS